MLGTNPSRNNPFILGTNPSRNKPYILGDLLSRNKPFILGTNPSRNKPYILGTCSKRNKPFILGTNSFLVRNKPIILETIFFVELMLWSSKVGTGVDCWLDNIQENPFQPRWLEVASRALSLAPGLAAAVVFPKWPPGKPEEVMLRSDFVFPVFRFFWNHYCVESKKNRAASCLQLCESFFEIITALSKRKTLQLRASNSVTVFFLTTTAE